MVVVAVIGGTGNVGKTIVDALRDDGKHEVVVLTRKAPESDHTVRILTVDYNDVEQLAKTLEVNNVHSIISTIAMFDEKAAQSELDLISAANKSSSTKRFIASNWGTATPDDESLRLPFNKFRDQSIAALRKTDLEWTQIHPGFFLDYYGLPHIASYLTPLVFAVDIKNKTAAIPGATGEETVTFTYTKDLAKFVVAALSLSKWEEALHCYSENVTLNQMVKIAEEVTESKFEITYDSVEKLQRGEITELPAHSYLDKYIPKPFMALLFSKFGLWVTNGLLRVPKEGSLNEQFPEIATTSVREVIGAWRGK